MNKKTIITFCAALFSLASMAQKDQTKTYQPNFNSNADGYLLGATPFGVSDNGEYVVGFGDEYTMSSFIWNRTTGKFQRITGAPYHTTDRDRSEVYAVSNDGTAVGGVEANKGYLTPAYWKDGTWTLLDDTRGMYSSATAISSDGRIISGHTICDVQKTDDEGNPKTASIYLPVQWVDGVQQPMFSWIPEGDKIGSGIYSYHASDDGKVLAINYVHKSGSQAPAASIDGKLKFFYGENDIDVNEDEYFYMGETTNVSRNGKFICGYFSISGTAADAKGFVYDVDNDELVQVTGLPSVVLNDGTYYTASSTSGSGTMCVTDDKSVAAGYKMRSSLSGRYAYPIISVNTAATGISNTEQTTDEEAAAYNTLGQRVSPQTRGIIISKGIKHLSGK